MHTKNIQRFKRQCQAIDERQMLLPAGCLPYLLSVTTKHGIYKFDAMRETGRDNIAGPERED